MKLTEKSKESLEYIRAIGSVLHRVVSFLQSLHSDLRSSLSGISRAFPAVMTILSTLDALFTMIIHGNLLHNQLRAQGRTVEQKEIERQRVMQVGGNALLFMVYATLAALLIAFPTAFPVVLASIATSQIVSAVRIAYAIYEKDHSERKLAEVFVPVSPPAKNELGEKSNKRFDKMLRDAVKDKITMSVLNAVTVSVILSGVFFPPIAIATNTMALVLVVTTISVSINYQRQKKQAGKEIRDWYSEAKQTHTKAQSVSGITSTTKLQVKPENKHPVTAKTMQDTSGAHALGEEVYDKKTRSMNNDTLPNTKTTLVHFSIFQHVGNMMLCAYRYNRRRRK